MEEVASPHGPIWHGATVLVVDNEPAMRSIVRRMLEAEQFHVEEAEDGGPRWLSFRRATGRSIWC